MPKVVPEYKKEARNRIVDVALEVFSEKGYDQTTMEDIGNRLGVSKGAIYLYFKSKEELFHAITEKAQNDLQETLSLSFKEGNLLQGADKFLECSMSPEFKNNLYLTFEFISEASRNEALKQMLKEDNEQDLKAIVLFLQGQRQRNIIRDDIDISSIAMAAMALYMGLRVSMILGMDPSDIRRAWKESIRALLCPLKSTN